MSPHNTLSCIARPNHAAPNRAAPWRAEPRLRQATEKASLLPSTPALRVDSMVPAPTTTAASRFAPTSSASWCQVAPAARCARPSPHSAASQSQRRTPICATREPTNDGPGRRTGRQGPQSRGHPAASSQRQRQARIPSDDRGAHDAERLSIGAVPHAAHRGQSPQRASRTSRRHRFQPPIARALMSARRC